MDEKERCCQNCIHAYGRKKPFCAMLSRDVEPEEICFQFSEKIQYCEAFEKLRKQFIRR